jgi:deoxyribodipyrimidine photo-lyase
VAFVPTRAAGLDRLADFAPHAGREYAALRNEDRGPGRNAHVSLLSPWLRHRLLREDEVIAAVRALHPPADCAKFVEEVCWRTYFKGHLEAHPSIWSDYRAGLLADLARLGADRALESRHAAAIAGRTGIDCFDAWVTELRDTGYLHNHARMWFASIWIFTLGLPWRLGADFTYRQFVDGDPASNTLSWRWVAGLHTRGKHYLARADNIARWSAGRFAPRGLVQQAAPLIEAEPPVRLALAAAPALPVDGPVVLLVTEEDLHPESLGIDPRRVVALIGASAAGARSPQPVAPAVHAFTTGALDDALQRAATYFGRPATLIPVFEPAGVAESVAQAIAESADVSPHASLVTGWLPVGPLRERWDETVAALASRGIRGVMRRRDWDERAWPHAGRGFFQIRERIPALLGHDRDHA